MEDKEVWSVNDALSCEIEDKEVWSVNDALSCEIEDKEVPECVKWCKCGRNGGNFLVVLFTPWLLWTELIEFLHRKRGITKP